MSEPVDVRGPLAPPWKERSWMRWLGTSNPFYVLSAGLFLAGLWLSFGEQAEDVETLALMTGLTAYTVLLAATAWLLVRFGNVWDDVRTVLLLVVLMFLATSVTFDALLVLKPMQGYLCSLIGFLLAIIVSEWLLLGTGLKLPKAFRIPYYLILGLFFLYPLALAPFLERDRPPSEAMMWGLFSFSPLAGLIFLTLLPAIHRGSAYVYHNGSPWRWPLYPWTLFALLALAVPARAFLLCWSMHLVRNADLEQLMFGFYFLVPFGFALCILLLQIGLVSRRRLVQSASLVLASGLVLLACLDHRSDHVYQVFLGHFSNRLGSDPLFLTLLGLLGFYAYAWFRRVSGAITLFSLVLVSLAFVGPYSLKNGLNPIPSSIPLLLAIVLQLALGIWQHRSGRCLLAGLGMIILVSSSLPLDWGANLRFALNYHHILLIFLIIGSYFRDETGRFLGRVGVFLAVLAFLFSMTMGGNLNLFLIQEWIKLHPPILALIVLGYGLWVRERSVQIVGAIGVGVGMSAFGWGFYRTIKRSISGLDHIVLGLACFLVAIVVSAWKSGKLYEWMQSWSKVQVESIPIVIEDDEVEEAFADEETLV